MVLKKSKKSLISTASKRRAFKKFSFRGIDLANLFDLRDEQLVKLLNARARRRFSHRGLQRKQMALLKKLRKAKKEAAADNSKPEVVKTHLRNTIIVPEMIGSVVGVYNGKAFTAVEIKVVEALDGVKVYNVSAGKTLPEWLAERQKNLKKNVDFQSRIELIQDCAFPTSAQKLQFTRDQKFLIGIGTYKPRVKIWELSELSVKVERYLDCDAVDFALFESDWRKMAVLRADRVVEFHSQAGKHHMLRIPKFGRQMAYESELCDLFAVGASNEAYRINLEQGRFLTSFETSLPEINTVTINKVHGLTAFGGTNGVIEAWDPRDRRCVGTLSFSSSPSDVSAVTAFAFADDGLTFAVGDQNGTVRVCDLRGKQPLYVKEHGGGECITSVAFHGGSVLNNADATDEPSTTGVSQCVLSSDRRLIKVWDRATGVAKVNIESEAKLNQVLAFSPHSGLLFAASEQTRVQIFYVPSLGAAPRWCSFLDNITEELEEERRKENEVFEDQKFVTREELTANGLDALLGTKYLRPYMHGFFVDTRLYAKMVAAARPFAYDEWRKQRAREKIDERTRSRIVTTRPKYKVNAELAREMAQHVDSATANGDDGAQAVDAAAQTLVDPRFGRLFTDEEFAIDDDDQANTMRLNQARRKRNKGLSQAEIDAANERRAGNAYSNDNADADDDDGRLFEEFFDPVMAREHDLDDDERIANGDAISVGRSATKRNAKQQPPTSSTTASTSTANANAKSLRMFALRNERATSVAATTALALGANSVQARATLQAARDSLSVPLAQRASAIAEPAPYETKRYIRELTFTPRDAHGGGNNNDDDDDNGRPKRARNSDASGGSGRRGGRGRGGGGGDRYRGARGRGRGRGGGGGGDRGGRGGRGFARGGGGRGRGVVASSRGRGTRGRN